MKLCTNCTNYKQSDNIIKCDEGYWLSTDKLKPRIYNPMMFECMHYTPIDGGSNVHHLFNLLSEITK